MGSEIDSKRGKRKFIRRGTVLIILGVLMLGIALGQLFIDIRRDESAGDNSEKALTELSDLILQFSSETVAEQETDDYSDLVNEYESVAENRNDKKKNDTDETQADNSTDETETTEDDGLPDGVYFQEMYYAYVDGHDYIGILEVPNIGLKLPVQWGWSDELMDTSPCRYNGTIEGNDIIIMAHNYATHFGGIFNMVVGDEVYFTDILGERIYYKVCSIEVFNRSEINKMYEGDWDLTLFTCVPNTYNRIAVRCTRA